MGHSAVDPFFPVKDGKVTHFVGVVEVWVAVEALFLLDP
jgi:hypothetical protein